MSKNLLIIGGTSGIGRELVELVKADYSIYTASRDGSALENTGIPHLTLDVTGNIPEIDNLPEKLDGFVYCPGSINLKPLKMLGEEAFRSEMEINFFGLVKVLKQIMPRFNEGASLVFFSTVAVQSGMPFHASIAAAKGAVEAFARSMAAEYAPKLRVNVIAPSLVDTPLAGRLLNNEQKREKMGERHPMQRTGTPGDIARAAAFLLSDENSWITGQVLGVDGGLSTLNVH